MFDSRFKMTLAIFYCFWFIVLKRCPLEISLKEYFRDGYYCLVINVHNFEPFNTTHSFTTVFSMLFFILSLFCDSSITLSYFQKTVKHFFKYFLSFSWATERVGFEPTRPCGQTVFKTASLWPLRYLSKGLLEYFITFNYFCQALFLFIFLTDLLFPQREIYIIIQMKYCQHIFLIFLIFIFFFYFLFIFPFFLIYFPTIFNILYMLI